MQRSGEKGPKKKNSCQASPDQISMMSSCVGQGLWGYVAAGAALFDNTSETEKYQATMHGVVLYIYMYTFIYLLLRPVCRAHPPRLTLAVLAPDYSNN